MKDVTQLSDLDQRVIRSLQSHISTGYEKSAQEVNVITNAIRQGKIRLTRQHDGLASFEDLAGDCFNPDANPSVPSDQLKREATNFRNRLIRSGAWVMTAEYWTGRYWEGLLGCEGNSIGGFVGNDFFGSGYELQVMQAVLDAYNAQELDSDGFVIDPFRNAA